MPPIRSDVRFPVPRPGNRNYMFRWVPRASPTGGIAGKSVCPRIGAKRACPRLIRWLAVPKQTSIVTCHTERHATHQANPVTDSPLATGKQKHCAQRVGPAIHERSLRSRSRFDSARRRLALNHTDHLLSRLLSRAKRAPSFEFGDRQPLFWRVSRACRYSAFNSRSSQLLAIVDRQASIVDRTPVDRSEDDAHAWCSPCSLVLD